MSNSAAEMAVLPFELNLVLAATRDMGIGLRGTLPWTGLKKEMAYFARVTKRLPPSVSLIPKKPPDFLLWMLLILTVRKVTPPAMNAVIMGRKTWDSIPPKFRPLKGRLNIVLSRSFGDPPQEPTNVETDFVKASSLEQAVTYLRNKAQGALGHVFVIGGGQIYTSALEMAETKRILLTRVMSDFECDTFFSLQLNDQGDSAGQWVQRSKEELDRWTGETVPEGVQVENETSYEFQIWEKAG